MADMSSGISTPIRSTKSSGSQGKNAAPSPIFERSNRYAAEVGMLTATSRRHTQPWLDANGEVHWSKLRIVVCKLIDHKAFEFLMALVVTANIVLIVMETDHEAKCYPDYANRMEDCPHFGMKDRPWIDQAGVGLLLVYTVEVLLRLYVERRRYYTNGWNLLDAFVVVTGWLSMFLGNAANSVLLRFIRLFRLTRMLRLFLAFRELYMLLSGLISAMRTIMWGSAMMFGTLLVFSILLVEFVHPINSAIDHGDCERCGRGYATVFHSTLTMFQTIIAGDSWGMFSVAVIEDSPLTAVLFVTSLMMVSLGLTNLILAVIVERAAEAREKDTESKLRQKEEEQQEQQEVLLKMCTEIDKDKSGTLTINEVREAFDHNEAFASTIQLMDIRREELDVIFKVLDVDGNGDVSYHEFIHQLSQMKARNVHTMLAFNRFSIDQLQADLAQITERILNPVREEVRESWSVLKDHGRLLRSIDERLDKLCDDRHRLNAQDARPWQAPTKPQQQGVRNPSVPPKPFAAPDRPAPTAAKAAAPLDLDGVLAEIDHLGSHTLQLAGLKGTIVRRVEEQVATLMRAARTLKEIGGAVRSSSLSPPPSPQGGDGAPSAPGGLAGASSSGRICEKLGRLQGLMHGELGAMLEEVDQKLEDGAAMLARGNELLVSLSDEVGCGKRAPIGPQQGSGGGGVGYEEKADQDRWRAKARASPVEPAFLDFTACTSLTRTRPAASYSAM